MTSKQINHITENNSYLITLENYLTKEEADILYEKCKNLDLITEPRVKTGVCHRRVGFYSNEAKGYYFSGQLTKSKSLPQFLDDITQKVNMSTNLLNPDIKLNSDLINHYRDGSDYIGKHSDNEKGLNNGLICAISLGGSRKFRIRYIDGTKFSNGKAYYDIITSHGQLLIMGGDFQKIFTHEIPIELSNKNPERLSITIRSHKKDIVD